MLFRSIDVLMALEHERPAQGHAAEAFQVAERARARGLLDLLALSGTDLTQGVDPELVARERTLRWRLNARAAIQTRLLMSTPDDKRLGRLERELSELTQTWRDAVTAIRQQSPAYTTLAEPQPLTASAVQALLDPQTVLLEYIAGEAHSWLFALTDTSFRSYELPAAKTIDEAARTLHRLVTSHDTVDRQELVEQLRAVSRLVLTPAAHELAKIGRAHV